MMQSSGTTEGMRGLIDSSLLRSVEKIIKYRGVFGPTVLPIGEKGKKVSMLPISQFCCSYQHSSNFRPQ